MKASFVLSLALGLGVAGVAGAGLTARPGLQTVKIIWSIPTNHWPEKLWVYQVTPQEYPEAVMSNLLTLVHFTAADMIEANEYKANVDKKASVFGTLGGLNRNLVICPTLGFIEYRDGKAEASMTSSTPGVPEPVMGVPNQEEATRLGIGYVRLLGIDSSELATKPGTEDFDLHWDQDDRSYRDRKTGKEIEEAQNIGIYFDRRIDGLNVAGIGYHGGVYIRFGNNARISDLRVTWRNLKPCQLLVCPSPEQIAGWINQNRIALRNSGGHIPKPIQELTIFKATFVYDGEPGEKPMDLVFPYAIFEATAAGINGTNNVWFKTPMTFTDENWRILR